MATAAVIEKRLRRVSKDRFEGAIFLGPDGEPRGATDGHILVVLGVQDAPEAAALELRAEEGAPDLKAITRVCEALAPLRGAASCEVTRHTPPEPDMLAFFNAETEASVSRAKRTLEICEERLAEALDSRFLIGDCRKRLAEAKAGLRDFERELRQGDSPTANALVVGPSAFDLRVVRRALNGLGAMGGTLSASGSELDPGLLVTDNGIAIVMPFRR